MENAELPERLEGARLSEQVYEWITDQIVNGSIWPGQWVSEQEIASTLGVSKSPVHEALNGLARDGVVRVIPRRGTIIAEASGQDFEEIYLAKALVEGEVVALTTPGLSSSQIDELAQLSDDMKMAIGEHLKYYDCSNAFWGKLRAACPNEVIADLADLLWRRALRYCGIIMRIPGIEARSQAKVEELVHAIRACDIELARGITGEIFREHCGIAEIKQGLSLNVDRPRPRGPNGRISTRRTSRLEAAGRVG